MKKLFLLLLFCLIALDAKAGLREDPVASLPSGPAVGTTRIVIDGITESDCSVGGGNKTVLCTYTSGGTWVPGGGGSGSLATGDALPLTCTPGGENGLFLDLDDEQLYACTATDTFVLVTLSEADTLQTAVNRGASVNTANSLPNAVCIGATLKLCFYEHATYGPLARPSTDGNSRFYIWPNFNGCILFDVEGDACMLDVDPDAASRNAMYQFGANYKPLASIPVTLYPRGAASYSEASIVSNQPKGGYIQITDVDTDAVDFRFVVTGKMVGVTTAMVRLYGVSDHASPSGNIVLNCAMRSNRPGTDTYVAHSTTGEAAITLTPATQNRPVSAVTSAITLNGTVAEFSEVEGSCEVNASSTTSAQLTDFFLRAEALVQLNVNSWSD